MWLWKPGGGRWGRNSGLLAPGSDLLSTEDGPGLFTGAQIQAIAEGGIDSSVKQPELGAAGSQVCPLLLPGGNQAAQSLQVEALEELGGPGVGAAVLLNYVAHVILRDPEGEGHYGIVPPAPRGVN